VMVDTTTDNRNRTVSEIRNIFNKTGGNLGETGSVGWMFAKKGYVVVPKSSAKEDDLLNLVLENGGDDLRDDGENWEVITDPTSYEAVLTAIKAAGITPETSEISMLPQNYTKVEGSQANAMIRLLEALEEQDDVQNVYSNADIDAKQLEEAHR
jgi:YebC/PmpR family DNA-binding regulatory protein